MVCIQNGFKFRGRKVVPTVNYSFSVAGIIGVIAGADPGFQLLREYYPIGYGAIFK